MSAFSDPAPALSGLHFAEHTILAAEPVPGGPTVGTRPRPLDRSPRRLLRLVFRRPHLLLAGGFGLALIIASLAPGWLAGTGRDPLAASAREAFLAPSLQHPLGTDENGRDEFARLVFGARSSLVLGVAATVLGLGAGVTLGLAAGLGPRWMDASAMRAMDVLLAFPELLFALVVIAFFGPGTFNAIVAIGVASVPRYARLVRAQVRTVRHSAYVEAATTLGLSPVAIVWRHILPNSIKPVLVLAIIGVGGKIAAGASLSFLGLGAPPPAPEWGSMLAIGRNFLANAWWLIAAPGAAITLTVLSISALGRAFLRRTEGKEVI